MGKKKAKPKQTPVVVTPTVQVVKHEIPGTGIELDRWENFVHPLVPTVDPNYVFRLDLVEEVAYCLATGSNCMLVGDAGVGKSTLIIQLAAQLNRPLVRLNLNGESDTTVLLGRDFPTISVDGTRSMEYRWGPLPKAIDRGYWILLDEIDAALQPVLFCLQQVLEKGGNLVLEDVESTVVAKHPLSRIFATANTVGIAGRNRILYSGTAGTMNEAQLDRWDTLIEVPYMDSQLEEMVISKNVPTLDMDFITGIVTIANEARKNLQDDRLACTFSTRRCLQWAQAMTHFHPLRAAKMTILNKLSQDDYAVLSGVIQRFFGSGS